MGLGSREKEGCRQILLQLDTSDLLSLCHTVVKSHRMVPIRAELIEKIIEHSKSATELLNRKKVYKEIILNYLNQENVFMYANSKKSDIIQKAIAHWHSPDNPITVNSKASGHIMTTDIADDNDLSQISFQLDCLSINSNQEDQPPAPQPYASVKPSSKAVNNEFLSPKKPLKQTHKAFQPEQSSKPSASTITGESCVGATGSVSESPSCPQRTVHNSKTKKKTTSQGSSVTSISVTVTVSHSFSGNTSNVSRDSSSQGTRPKKTKK